MSISNIYGIAWNLPELNEFSGISLFFQSVLSSLLLTSLKNHLILTAKLLNSAKE